MNYFQKNASSLFFALLIVLIITASAISFKSIKNLGFTAEKVNHTSIVKQKLTELLSSIKDAESGQRGYLLTNDSSFLSPMLLINKTIAPILNELENKLSDNPAQIAQLQKLENLISERLAISAQTLKLKQQQQAKYLIDSLLIMGKIKMSEVHDVTNLMLDSENTLLISRIEINNRNMRFTPIFTLIISLASVIFISIAFVKLREQSAWRQFAIEALKIKNDDLQQQQDFVDAIFDASVDVMSYLDKDLIFRKFNNAGVNLYGRSKEELIGKNFIELYPHVISIGLYQDLQNALNGQFIHKNEYYSPPTKKYFELFLVPLSNRKNELDGVLMIAHDISMIVESKHQLEQQNLQLEQSNQELSSFSYIASHDLKEPLRKIQIFTKRILDSTKFSDNIQDYFNRILSASERMQNLIDSLLNFSLANNSVLNFEPCDLNEVLEESKKYLVESIQEKNAQIVSDKLPVINGVSVQLTQLFTNLIDNSLKYSRNNVPPHISITVSSIMGREIKSAHVNRQKEYFVVLFKDNGIGFEQEYAHKIFEIFQRLHGRNQYTGTGIGLAICKKIVTNHQGIITAEGNPESGAEFKLYLPKEIQSVV